LRGERAVRLRLRGPDRERGRRARAAQEPALDHHRRQRTGGGGPGAGRGRRDAEPRAGRAVRVPELGDAEDSVRDDARELHLRAPRRLDVRGAHRRVRPDVAERAELMDSAPQGVLLINLGTPDAPETGAVRRYLREFLSDPRVLDIGPVGRAALLY